ncbi:LysR family transcriptional regulator [Pseudoclavibacter terrae]|uniref:LysR family transcriptional regulator n=1 Tax=Pseudoclavibacter terrae TaxID=1530195 RepID=UPI00232D3769|nr:LysR family transcriptional regulator [Pseudoclavibacter terrae]
MKPQSLDHLRAVVAVYRAGSVSEAARWLGLSQPTVSAHLRSVEDQLGIRLFDRESARLVPTAAAHELARTAGAHVDALDELLYPSLADARAAVLRVGGAAEFLREVVAPSLPRLLANVEASVSLRFGLAEELLEALAAGELDVVVSAVRPHGKTIRALHLFDEDFLLVGAPSWRPSSSGDALVELERIPLIAYAGHLPIVRRYWRTVFDRRPDALTVAAIVPDLVAIRSSLLAGAGMSVLPGYLVRRELEQGTLAVLHEPAYAPLNSVYVALRRGAEANEPAVERFAAALVELVKSQPVR